MGLTIQYTLSLRDPLTEAEVRALAGRARAFAREAGATSVSRVFRVEPDFPLAHEWVAVPESWGGATHVDVPPEAGFLFTVDPGRDCDSLLLGLCRYPVAVTHQGRPLRTRGGAGWRLQWFCKTQYASVHGWEHFFRCHLVVIGLLNFWRTLGARVVIRDDGGWWPRRSERTLRARLGEYNGLVAAMGGTLKDAGEGHGVESPIFAHPHFERLEAEGAQRHGRKLERVVRQIKRAAGGTD